jgi:hypothetical protein
MRTTITIDDDLLAQVKEIAARGNRSVSSVLEEAVRESLLRRTRPASQRVVLPVSGDPAAKPLVDILDREALAVVLEDDDL